MDYYQYIQKWIFVTKQEVVAELLAETNLNVTLAVVEILFMALNGFSS